MATFGDTSETAPNAALENQIYGLQATCPVNGTADSISVFMDTTDNGEDGAIKCALYASDVDDTPAALIKSTEQRILLGDIGSVNDTWVTFTFSAPKPTLVAGTKYFISAWANSTLDSISVYRSFTVGTNTIYNNPEPYGDWPVSESAGVYTTSSMEIYCTYTPTAVSVTEIDGNRFGSIYLDSTKNIGSDLDKAKSQYLKIWDFTTTDTKRAVRHKTKDFGS